MANTAFKVWTIKSACKIETVSYFQEPMHYGQKVTTHLVAVFRKLCYCPLLSVGIPLKKGGIKRIFHCGYLAQI